MVSRRHKHLLDSGGAPVWKEERPLADIRSYFAVLTAPRRPNARYRFLDILVIAICAVICGAKGWEESEEYGGVPGSWFEKLLD